MEKPRARRTPISRSALLDAELEEKPGQQQGGDHQEETEVDEVLAEIGRALGRREAAGFHRNDGQAHLGGVDARREVRIGEGGRGRRDADGRQLAEARAPELLASREGDEGFRRGAVLLPIPLVGGADAVQVEGEGRVPIAQAVRIR
jgi:hypothetical protein